MTSENLAQSLTLYLDTKDDLSHIEKTVYIKFLLNEAKKKGILDRAAFIKFSLLKIPFFLFLKEYKNISSQEAKILIINGHVTFGNVIDVFNLGLDKYSFLP